MVTDKELCWYAHRVYHDKPDGKCGIFDLEHKIYRGNEGEQIVAVRGTEFSLLHIGWRDLIRDVFAKPIDHDILGRCHSGFALGAERIYGAIEPSLNPGPVYVCGHSLGAAMAAELGELLLYDGRIVHGAVFGCPNYVIGEHSAGYPLRAYRYRSDLVTMVPPEKLLGYTLPVDTDVIQLGKRRGYPWFGDHDVWARYYEALERGLDNAACALVG